MESIYQSRQLFKVILFTTIFILLIPRCKPGEQNDEVAILLEKQAFITEKLDSMRQLLALKTTQYDTVYVRNNSLNEEIISLANKNKSLQSRNTSRGVELNKITSENKDLSNALSEKSTEIDSLGMMIALMQQKLTDTDNKKTEAEMNNVALAGSLKAKEQKIADDSIAIANKPIPPKETGFISISEIGGGLGLGDVSVDYSRNVVTINTIAGYQVNKHFIAAIGTGVNFYNGGYLVPLFLDFRYAFNEGKISPFIVADGGVLFNPDGLSSSGLFLNPAIGFKRKLNSRVSFHISAGGMVQNAPAPNRYSFFNFKGGVSFSGPRVNK